MRVTWLSCEEMCGEVWVVGEHMVAMAGMGEVWAISDGVEAMSEMCGEVWVVGEHVVTCVVRCRLWVSMWWPCGGHGVHG